MTASSRPTTAQYDTGPLSWVMGEIGEALGRSERALTEAAVVGADARATCLQHAKTHLHQAHGALQMVDVEGVGALTHAAEEALDRFKAGTLDCGPARARVVTQVYQAIVEYLEEVLAGALPQPARLFPYYRALQEMLGAERIHPADLFFADLSGPGLPATSAPAGAPDYAAYRARFEKALLPFLKSADAAAQRANAVALQEAVALVAGAQQEAPERTFWCAMHSFAELVAGGQIGGDLYVKQLFGLINLQMRRLSQGQGSLPQAMLRDALFFIAAAPDPSDLARQLRRAYRLDGMVPTDYELRRYGQIDPAALAAAKDALARAKTCWSGLAAADGGERGAFDDALGAVTQACEKLGVAALTQLLREIKEAVQAAAGAGGDGAAQFGLEVATALLFIEQGLDQIRRLPDEFGANAHTVGERLLALANGAAPPAALPWQGELARRIEHGQTVAVLAAELKTGLRQVEKVLDDYYGDPSRRATLAQIDPVLHQIEGALAILEQDHAMRAALHVRDAVRRLAGGEGDPDAAAASLQDIAQNVGALGFFTDMLGHDFDAARDRFWFDEAGGMLRSVPFKGARADDAEAGPADAAGTGAAPLDASPEPAGSPASPFAGSIAAPLEAPLEATPAATPEATPEAPLDDARAAADAAIETELLDIFISEAREVLTFVVDTLPAARAAPSDQATLTMLRRSFHTLKGSGRMVGLDQLADAAASIERVMNLWLSEGRSAGADLLALLECASAEMRAWVEELAANAVSRRTADALVAAAARVQEGGPFRFAETEAPAGTAAGSAAPLAGDTKRIGELEIAAALYDIYLAETDQLVSLLAQDFAAWRDEPQRLATPGALKAAHTLAGTSATVGFRALRELAHAMELALEALCAPAPVFGDGGRDLLDSALACARQMLQAFALGELAPPQPELVERLHALREQLGRQQGAIAGAADEPAEQHAGAGDEAPAPALDDGTGENALDALFDDAFDAPSLAQAPPPASANADAPELELELIPAEPEPEPELALALEAELGPEAGLELAPEADRGLEAEPELAAESAFEFELAPEAELEQGPAPELAAEFELAPGAEPAPAPDSVIELALELASALEPEPELDLAASDAAPIPAAHAATFTDELDPDLLPVFLEEATDLLPQIGDALRAWQHNPADTGPAKQLLRTLHTVKGSARMAGAMRLGQHSHEIETQVENMVHAGTSTPAAFDELMANYDQALLMFEQLQQGGAPAVPVTGESAAAVPGESAAPGETAAAVPAEAEDDHPAKARTALVRVRADILDRLVNQAGEVSIARSKLENQVGTMKSALSEFSDNLVRLRRQLREVEMQAESQIASRMSIAGEREFDPLEFDRFTRLQELTRMMAESVSDVASFHESLSRTVEGASEDLVLQSRLTRDLQRDLMRVRMVPFSSVAERLFRVARQSAKEVDKRVNLDIRGGAVEIDRSVLEQMVAPFEHLLRNAIAHGIEARDQRAAGGKSETGEVLVQVSQQGNEVVIAFSDDGAGLDLERIRAKARAGGLLGAQAQLSDAQTADLIFEPGLSTAAALTELAGRGVGMDVVRSQAQALGGRIAITSESGKGACFTIHLPLTLAVTQVVLVASGGKTYALPSVLVEQVLQMKEAAADEAHAGGVVAFHGRQVALHYLPTLLGDAAALPHAQRSCPVLVLKSGADRLALRVDDVVGNREVVIKNIGPQLSRMIGIAGATVLGSGDIVLILNPVVLARHLDHHPELRAHGAAASGAGRRARDHVIMVVDDSLTVRRVSAHLLEREGYKVMLAKDGVDALEQLQQTVPDLMLVDIEMPRMDGFDLTRNIRGNDSTRAIPIIMITSRTADKHRNVALELGVNAYFGKPFQEPILLAAIAGLLGEERP